MTTLTFRRGAEEINRVVEENAGGNSTFTPFLPNIYWKENNEEKYLLFLNEIDQIPTVDLITFIPDGKRFANVIARTDASVGLRKDPLVEEWDATVRKISLAVAVELEPLIEVVDNRKRPRGFEVATRTFERRIRDEDGELTDEVEEVIAPLVGIVIQSPSNFFNHIASYDATDGPIHQTPLKITRVGKDSNTSYRVTGYPDQQIDLTSLITYLDGISYLNEEEREDLADSINGETPETAGLIVGELLLEKHLEELHDEDRYNRLYGGVTASLDTFGSKKKSKTTKTARPSQRRERSVPTDTEASAPKPEKEKVTQASPASTKMEEIRALAAAKRAAKSAASKE